MYFDGSDVSLATTTSEDVDGASFTSSGTILLSTEGVFAVPGVAGDDEDVFEFLPSRLGGTTTGTYAAFLDLSARGIDSTEDIAALELVE